MKGNRSRKHFPNSETSPKSQGRDACVFVNNAVRSLASGAHWRLALIGATMMHRRLALIGARPKYPPPGPVARWANGLMVSRPAINAGVHKQLRSYVGPWWPRWLAPNTTYVWHKANITGLLWSQALVRWCPYSGKKRLKASRSPPVWLVALNFVAPS